MDYWQKIFPAADNYKSEEFLISTIRYIGNDGAIKENGISTIDVSYNESINLKDLISSDEESFLGKRYASQTYGNCGVLARAGDSAMRLILQVHPDDIAAKSYLNIPFGKTEAWYILNTRIIDNIDPYIYLGFKPGVTRTLWQSLFKEQNVEGMLNCLHKIPVKAGDTILVEAGMPHAMGSGCLFLEIHEPCDYTFRLERQYNGHQLSDNSMHYGFGFSMMLDLLHYDTYTKEDILKKCIMTKVVIDQMNDNKLVQVISYKNTDKFSIMVLDLSGVYELPKFDGHYILVASCGDTKLVYKNGCKVVPQGRGVFVPANVGKLRAEGNGELIIAYPFLS